MLCESWWPINVSIYKSISVWEGCAIYCSDHAWLYYDCVASRSGYSVYHSGCDWSYCLSRWFWLVVQYCLSQRVVVTGHTVYHSGCDWLYCLSQWFWLVVLSQRVVVTSRTVYHSGFDWSYSTVYHREWLWLVVLFITVVVTGRTVYYSGHDWLYVIS